MNNCTILAELLFIISNYEKGRISAKNIWSKKYINSLQDSFCIMGVIIDIMKNFDKTILFDIEPILVYIYKNTGTIFNKDIFEKTHFAYKTNLLFQFSSNPENKELLELMEKIINSCSSLIKQKERNYKKKISYLIMALHNIPRAFLNKDKETYLNVVALPLTLEEAKGCAYSYIQLSRRCS